MTPTTDVIDRPLPPPREDPDAGLQVLLAAALPLQRALFENPNDAHARDQLAALRPQLAAEQAARLDRARARRRKQ